MNKQLQQLSEGLELISNDKDDSIILKDGILTIHSNLSTIRDYIVNLESFSPQPTTDWSKVAIDTPILVFDTPYYFAGYDAEKNEVLYFYYRCNSRGNRQAIRRHRCSADNVTIDTEAQSQLKWIKNTGVQPLIKSCVVKLNSGKFITGNASAFGWHINKHYSDILEYIPLPD